MDSSSNEMDSDIRSLIEGDSAPQHGRVLPAKPTQAQMVKAYEWAENHNVSAHGFERRMVHAQHYWIEEVQQEQAAHPISPGEEMVAAHRQMQAYQWILDHQEDQRRQAIARQRKAELAAVAEMIRAMGVPFQEAATAFASVFKDASDAMIAALRPLLDLLDEGEDIPRQQVCPSHACAMRGGRCPRCDRRRR